MAVKARLERLERRTERNPAPPLVIVTFCRGDDELVGLEDSDRTYLRQPDESMEEMEARMARIEAGPVLLANYKEDAEA